MSGLFAVLKNPSIIRQNHVILHPNARGGTPKPYPCGGLWGVCGGLLSNEGHQKAENPSKTAPKRFQNTPSRLFYPAKRPHFLLTGAAQPGFHHQPTPPSTRSYDAAGTALKPRRDLHARSLQGTDLNDLPDVFIYARTSRLFTRLWSHRVEHDFFCHPRQSLSRKV
jgi:hypothetical protein